VNAAIEATAERDAVPGLAAALAAFGVPGPDRPPIAVTRGQWPAFLGYIEGQKLVGLAVAAASAGALDADGHRIDQLRTSHRAAMAWALTVDRTLVELAGSFEEAGVELVALKGPVLAHLAYPDPTWRSYGDLDLLVRTEEWPAACAVLEAEGFVRDLPEPRRGFSARFGKAASFSGPGGLSVDLHRTLALGPFGLWLSPEDLFGRTASFRLGGRSILRLDDTALLAHAAAHAVLGWTPPLLLPLRDVVQVTEARSVDWERLEADAERWRLTAVVQSAMRTARDVLGAQIPPEAERLMIRPVDRREAHALGAYAGTRRLRGGMAVATLAAIDGLKPKAEYVSALLFPSREFLAVRGATAAQRWGRSVRRLVRR
jgi:hypothetical protein